MTAVSGYLALVLHAHLPFVRHPEHDEFLEEDWLYQAISECYVPLLSVCDSLIKDRVPFRLTLVVTPTLLEMLTDDLLMSRYRRYQGRLIKLAESEVQRTRRQPRYNSLARMYLKRFQKIRNHFTRRWGGDLVACIRRLRDSGRLALFTSAATHAYLPLLLHYPQAIRAQLKTALRCHRRHFGRPPDGIWLPECGYAPGLDELLQELRLSQFVLAAHGILHADPRPVFGTCAPILCPSGAAAFARDPQSSWQVWSAEAGYPGDFDYREFYREEGFDLDYHRITGGQGRKQIYNPQKAADKARAHAWHFVSERERHILALSEETRGDPPPILVCPYDAELFGHWWYEGPVFLENVLRGCAANPHLECTTLPGYLDRHPVHQIARPAPSSWGAGGHNHVWLNPDNDWIYPPLHRATAQMQSLARTNPRARGLKLRALNQCARELLLAQSSDWAFIMHAKTAVEYATRRTKDHLIAFETLSAQIQNGKIDRLTLESHESRNSLFPDIDYRDFT